MWEDSPSLGHFQKKLQPNKIHVASRMWAWWLSFHLPQSWSEELCLAELLVLWVAYTVFWGQKDAVLCVILNSSFSALEEEYTMIQQEPIKVIFAILFSSIVCLFLWAFDELQRKGRGREMTWETCEEKLQFIALTARDRKALEIRPSDLSPISPE